MAAVTGVRCASDQNSGTTNQIVDRLKILYPMVNEEETPLPRSWSPKDKYNYIGLSQNNLRVHYKGKTTSYTYLDCLCISVIYLPIYSLFLVLLLLENIV